MERIRFLRAIRLVAEGEKHESAQRKTCVTEKKMKLYGKDGQGCFPPDNWNNVMGDKKIIGGVLALSRAA
ncbi:hypothetical protein [Treponema sp. R8-4-B8]